MDRAALIIDIIFAVVFFFSVFMSYKRGFWRIFLETAGLILSMALAIHFGGVLGEWTYDKVVEPKLVKVTVDTVSDTTQTTVEKLFDCLPEFLRSSDDINNAKDNALNELDRSLDGNTKEVATVTSREFLKPPVSMIFSLLYTLVLFAALSFIFKLLKRLFGGVFDHTKLTDKINKFLGAVLGIPRGLIACIALALLISLLNRLLGDSLPVISSEILDKTKIYSFIISFAPLAK